MSKDLQNSAIFTPGVSDASPPVGDAEREAIASLGGYTYQVAAAALAWLDLPDGARLYLEVVEDYATVAEQALNAVQVKDTAGSGSITLNSETVRDAVDAFVRLVDSNPERNVQLRYFSTSPIGTEQRIADRPDGQPGLLYWRKAAAGADVSSLKAILTSEKFSEAVRNFVNARDENALRRDLLQKIHWDCGKPGLPDVISELEERLIVLGRDRFQLPAPEARRLSDITMFQVLKKSILKKAQDRVLTRGELYNLIDAVTRISLPRSGVEAMTQFAATLSGVLGGTSTPASSFTTDHVGWIIAGHDLPAPGGMIARISLEAKADAALSEHGAALLIGASGLGKSLVARGVAQKRDQNFSLIDLRNLEADETRRRLDFLFGRIGTLPSQIMIFEDLNHLDDPGIILSFGRIMAALRRRDRTALVTCYLKPTVGSISTIEINADALIEVPYFSEAEAKEVVSANGGVPDVWGPLAYAAGGVGHPQLVHAFVVGMAARGWPTSEQREVVARGLSSDDVDAARVAARRQLAVQLPEPARNLLYRLSLLTSRFDRSLALRIGTLPPPIPGPGDNLDTLVGPWIEAVGTNRYRVSPLASQFGNDSLTAEEQRTIHAAIASQMLERQQIDASDANTAFLHALAGKFAPGLLTLSLGITTSNQETRAMLAEQFFAFRLLRTDRPIYPENVTLSRILRLAQFLLVAAGGDGSKIRPTAAALLEEVGAGASDQLARWFEALALSSILITMGIANHLPEWMSLLRRYRALVDSDPALQGLKANTEGADGEKRLKFYGVLFEIGATGISSIERLEQVVNDLQQLDHDERRLWLQGYEDESLGFAIFVNGPWSAEHKRDAINAADAAERFRRMAELTRDWGIKPLTLQFHVARAVMLDEYGHNQESALVALDEAESALGNDIVLDRARAKIYWRDNNYVAALQIWQRIADRVPRDSPVERAFSLREAAINAAKADDWTQAEAWFLEAEAGAASSDLQDMKPMAIGLAADSAVAALHAGGQDRTLLGLAKALEELRNLNPEMSLRAAYCHRVVRHTVLWVQMLIEQREKTIDGEPTGMLPGTCSNPEPPDLRELPLGPLDIAWYMLAEAEITSGSDVGIQASLRGRLASGPIPMLEVDLRHRTFAEDIKALDASKFAEHLMSFVEGMAFLKADGEALRRDWDVFAPPRGELPVLNVDDSVRVWADPVAGDGIMCFFIMAALSSDFEAIDALSQALAAKFGTGYLGEGILKRWRDYGDELVGLDEVVVNIIKAMRTGAHIEPREVGSIGLRLFERARHSGFNKLLTPRIGRWLRSATERIIAEESFRLSRPMQIIPELQAVLSNGENNERFVASLLLTLSDAVGVSLATAYRDQLRNIADGHAAGSAAPLN